MMVKAKEMTDRQLVEACIVLDRRMNRDKKDLNRYMAELQARATAIMDDHNVQYVRFYGDRLGGSVSISDRVSLDILNPTKLELYLGKDVYRAKVKEDTTVKYKVNAQLARALKAVSTGDYTFEYTLSEFLDEMEMKPDAQQKKLLLKKLKGDFEKDRQTLAAVLAPVGDAPDFDVELMYIYRIKNAELIQAFFPEEGLDGTLEEVKRCIMTDTSTAVTIDYDDDEEED